MPVKSKQSKIIIPGHYGVAEMTRLSPLTLPPIHAVDLFCGAGGTSTGLIRACLATNRTMELLAINHWQIAIDTHRANHPDARHICAPLESIDPRVAVPGGHLDILVASPECTHHSNARGGKPVSDQLRASAWHIIRWLELLTVDNILIENVREFRDWGPTDVATNRPIKHRKGETYQAFLTVLLSMNYVVEDRILNAADYGDPTSRRRLFILARRGEKKIHWPMASHADNFGAHPLPEPIKPFRSAREIIDWSLPGKSIFSRKKPLAPATMARIAAGLRKYGGEKAEPFLVMMYGTNDARSLDRPMPTVTAGGNKMALCEPFILGQQSCAAPRSVDQPLPTIATAGRHHCALVEPFLIHTNHAGGDRTHNIDKPVPTITCGHRGEMALVDPFIVRYHGNHPGNNDGEKRTHTIDKPLPTLDTSNRYALVEPFLAILKGQSKTRDLNQPCPTITTNPHLYLCEPFLTKYYGKSKVQSLEDPIHTITTKECFALVEPQMDVEGEYVLLDIRFRMLQPHELAAGMGFDKNYKFTGNKGDQVKQIGNAVPVCTATALCLALLEN